MPPASLEIALARRVRTTFFAFFDDFPLKIKFLEALARQALTFFVYSFVKFLFVAVFFGRGGLDFAGTGAPYLYLRPVLVVLDSS